MQRSSGLETRRYSALRGRAEADAAVIGGGLTGLTCALWLSRAGLKVVLLEAETLGFGASSRCTGMVSLLNRKCCHALEKQAGVQSLESYVHTSLRALQSVAQLAGEGRCGWQEAPANLLQYGKEDELALEAECLKRAGITADLKRDNDGLVLQLSHMGMLDTAKYLQYLAHNAAALDVRIFEGSRMVSVETNEVHTQNGVVRAPYIIVATGYPVINVPGWYFMKMQQKEGTILSMHGSCSLEGMWFDAEGQYAIRPYAGGGLLHSWNREGEAVKIAAQTGMTLSNERYSGWECFTQDGLPFIGPYSRKTPNLFVASGYEGRGILGSMLAAHAISAKILGLPSYGYDIYSGQRKMNGFSVPLSIG